jgi:hypothetical protein
MSQLVHPSCACQEFSFLPSANRPEDIHFCDPSLTFNTALVHLDQFCLSISVVPVSSFKQTRVKISAPKRVRNLLPQPFIAQAEPPFHHFLQAGVFWDEALIEYCKCVFLARKHIQLLGQMEDKLCSLAKCGEASLDSIFLSTDEVHAQSALNIVPGDHHSHHGNASADDRLPVLQIEYAGNAERIAKGKPKYATEHRGRRSHDLRVCRSHDYASQRARLSTYLDWRDGDGVTLAHRDWLPLHHQHSFRDPTSGAQSGAGGDALQSTAA